MADPIAADLLPVNPPNVSTTMAMQYRSAWREGVEDGWYEARAVLARWGRPGTPSVRWIVMPDIGTAPSWRLVDPRDIGPYHTHWRHG
jgi:hypothetical protein